MSLVDSKPAFKSRCLEVCGDDDIFKKLEVQGVLSFSELAFACGTPSAQPSEDEFRTFAEKVGGSGISMGDSSKLRRLLFEASTFVVAQLKAQVTTDGSETIKKLPLAEKSARAEEQKRRLRGLIIEEELSPSHGLIDLISNMIECNVLQWIPPAKCTKREQELKLVAKDRSKALSVLDGSNAVVLSAVQEKISADHSTPLHLQWCLQRRGLAFDMMNIIKWESHERWTAFLLQALTRDVPAGYSGVSVNQLLKADAEMFLLISKEIPQVKALPSGVLPVDEALNRLRTDPRITMHLLPLPKGMTAAAPSERPSDSTQPPLKKRKTGSKGGGLLAAPKTESMPEEMKQCKFYTASDGRRLCWAHNMDGCPLETDHKNPPACRKGVHGCGICRKAGHGARQCWHRNKGSKGAGKGKSQKGTGEAKE